MVAVSLVAFAALSVNELHSHYGAIFATGNRNAASHLWASYILREAKLLSKTDLEGLFAGFCPVSGSPVQSSDYNAYHYTLRSLVPGGATHASGLMHHCCAPCVCDSQDLIWSDTKTVAIASGPTALTFAVIGDPCRHASALQRTFTDPFTGGETTLGATAPEVQCDAGKLKGATYSDHDAVIIGLLSEAPALSTLAPTEPTPGRVTTVGAATFQDSREYSGYCASRASQGYNSGMGVIFRQVAQITPLEAHTSAVNTASSACAVLLPASRVSAIEQLIRSEPVLIFGMKHTRCLSAASERLEAAGACFRLESWERRNDPLWQYMQCLHPNELVNGVMMHSYVYIGGEYIGNGFALLEESMSAPDLRAKLTAASARMTCGQDCAALASPAELAQLEAMKREPLALLGWSGCPCTNIARSRFESVGACYVQKVWADDTAALFKHLQCVHGQHHHSFVFANGRFVGDGFALEEGRLPTPAFEQLLLEAGSSRMCQRRGDANLFGAPLQSCTQSNDGSTTGWTRTGSCNWDPSDSGYHEVCVTMSDEFLRQSARHDANDLSSVVQHGGHWCICAWAWASAVQRDPSSYEGIALECERTNNKLRDVYEEHISSGADLHSPSGAAYKAKAALDAVNRLCPPRNVSAATGAAARAGASPHLWRPTAPLVLGLLPPLLLLAVWMITATGRSTLLPCLSGAGSSDGKHRPIAGVAVPTGLDVEDKLGCYDSCEESGGESGGSRARRVMSVMATPLTKDSL